MDIMVAIDLPLEPDALMGEAKRFGALLPGKIWLLHVAPPDPDFVGYEAGPQSVRDSLAERFHEEHNALAKLADELRDAGLEVTPLMIQGPTVESILREAERLEVGMIVMGFHHHGLIHQMLTGSTSKGILRGARCPVLVVPPHDEID